MQKRHKILIVGQTPPPYHGQAIMIEKILNFQSDELRFFHVRMNFSSDMNDIGKVRFNKFFELFKIIAAIYWHRIVHNVKILYYPPAGPDTVPILRDIVILSTTRFLFQKIIFHFHAGGLSEKFAQLKPAIRFGYKRAYFHPDLTIRLSKLNPDDGNFLKTKKDLIVPYGIDDVTGQACIETKTQNERVHILFAGVLKETKGVGVLIEAAALMVANGCDNFQVSLMGRFDSKQYEAQVKSLIQEKNLENHVEFLGVKTGTEKFAFFRQCNIFCFPSFYEAETFGVVLLEAMQFAKPLVATRWRGIPDIVKEGVNGLLVEPQNSNSLGEVLMVLIKDENLRNEFGKNGAKAFREKYTTEIFRQNFQDAVRQCIE